MTRATKKETRTAEKPADERSARERFPVMAHPIVAAVCDIRGFTDFTAMVDAINRSDQVEQDTKSDLLKQYNELVADTQEVAVSCLLEPLVTDLASGGELKSKLQRRKRRATGALGCAVKSTGDGFLIALALVPEEEEDSGLPYCHDIQRIIATRLGEGLLKVVDSAGGPNSGEIRNRLTTFFGVWEDFFGLRLEREPDKYRVAGAMAIGTGRIVPAKMSEDSAIYKHVRAKVDRGGVLGLRADAYGHGVNLAFRLCDRSGRKTSGPYVLLDRRVGQLLIELEGNGGEWRYRKRALPSQRLTRIRFEEPMKGIDEMWCYGLQEEPEKVELVNSTFSGETRDGTALVEIKASLVATPPAARPQPPDANPSSVEADGD